MTFQSPEICT